MNRAGREMYVDHRELKGKNIIKSSITYRETENSQRAEWYSRKTMIFLYDFVYDLLRCHISNLMLLFIIKRYIVVHPFFRLSIVITRKVNIGINLVFILSVILLIYDI